MRPGEVSDEQFDAWVEEAMGRLPDWVQPMLAETAVAVENAAPHPHGPGTLLLGLYQGIPRTRYGPRPPGAMPDTITLFKDAILAVCHDAEQVREKVFEVLAHEVGHELGLSDARLRELGW